MTCRATCISLHAVFLESRCVPCPIGTHHLLSTHLKQREGESCELWPGHVMGALWLLSGADCPQKALVLLCFSEPLKYMSVLSTSFLRNRSGCRILFFIHIWPYSFFLWIRNLILKMKHLFRLCLWWELQEIPGISETVSHTPLFFSPSAKSIRETFHSLCSPA